MLIKVQDELLPALTAVLRRGVETETDGRLKRDAGDALVEIERRGHGLVECTGLNCAWDL